MSEQDESHDESQSSIISLLLDWQHEVLRSQRGHYQSTLYFERWHRWIGVPTAIAAAGAENGSIIREIKILLALPTTPDKQALDHVRERRDSLANRSPTIPSRIWARADIPTRESA